MDYTYNNYKYNVDSAQKYLPISLIETERSEQTKTQFLSH